MIQNRRSRGVQATAAGVESLEARRVNEDWTRQALANRVGVALDTLERLIKRERVDRDSVRRIVAALNLQPTDIIDPDEWHRTHIRRTDQQEDLFVVLPVTLSDSPIGPERPVGQVPLESAFYVERPPIEAQCCQEIVHPGALIRIKAPKQMGKTSLTARILEQAREQGCRTTHLSLQSAPSKVLSNIDQLMQWFCRCVSEGLHLPNQLDQHWDDIYDGNYNSTVYFKDYLLAASSPLVIGLDEVDRVFEHPEIATDFFALLRAWYEKARYGDRDSDTWKKLRLIVIHSTEVYIPMNLNQSPFNVGLSIELPEITLEQVQDLTQRYQLDWTLSQIEELMRLVGGHPYLLRVAMYAVAHQTIAFEQVLEQAATELGVYSDHLRHLLEHLERYPELASAFSDVVMATTPVSLRSTLAFKLNSLGLATIVGNQVTPRCELYQQYFCERL
ncbi:AAA-like domain-containing protein [Phormidium sp. CLA17]|uniref:AAA-like domain-containing protein n=1 Tax=Leptolyngbya sp. Cla-17 TaxID=2803751 RepID=UPI00149257D4|nr:AAA-like domain-containing protein [Leptolyngbya sp. Cla-17]MBM0745468.1 AAA-like domain-containing protein [Leptolyngbya sp. Cla-17]